MKILLTGGTGYIGSHTAVELIKKGHEVEILDNLVNSKIEVLDAIQNITGVKPKFYQIDLTDGAKIDQLLEATKYDAVMHFAGLKAVSESIEEPLRYYHVNILSTLNLLDAMRRNHINKFIFSSSATVYGDQDGVKLTEEHQTGVNITNPYGKTKYVIEQILQDYAAANKEAEITILRYFNPVGAHPSGLLGENPNGIPNNLMPIIMQVATGKIEQLDIYGDDYDTEDGTCMRDFIHVVDLAEGHVAALDHIRPGVNIYNLGTGTATSVMTIVKTFEKINGKPLPYQITARRPGDLAKIYADPKKANEELDWHASLAIEDAMKNTINYLSKSAQD